MHPCDVGGHKISNTPLSVRKVGALFFTPQGKQISVSPQDLNRTKIENRAFPERKCKLIVMLAEEVKDDTTSGAQTKLNKQNFGEFTKDLRSSKFGASKLVFRCERHFTKLGKTEFSYLVSQKEIKYQSIRKKKYGEYDNDLEDRNTEVRGNRETQNGCEGDYQWLILLCSRFSGYHETLPLFGGALRDINKTAAKKTRPLKVC